MRVKIDIDLIKSYLENNTVKNVVYKGNSLSSLVVDGERIWHSCYKGHTWGLWEINKRPTCTTNGREIRNCTICGAPEVNIIPATGVHTSSGWIIDIEPTIETEGSKHKECTVCGKVTETVTIPKLKIVAPVLTVTVDDTRVKLRMHNNNSVVLTCVYRIDCYYGVIFMKSFSDTAAVSANSWAENTVDLDRTFDYYKITASFNNIATEVEVEGAGYVVEESTTTA